MTSSEFDGRLAHLGLRGLLGLNLAMHGLVRLISGVTAFADTTTAGFSGTVLPVVAVRLFACTIAPVELLLGLWVLLGVRPRAAYLVCMGWMAVLTFGSTIKQDWGVAGLQLTYGLALFVLLLFARFCVANPARLRTDAQ